LRRVRRGRFAHEATSEARGSAEHCIPRIRARARAAPYKFCPCSTHGLRAEKKPIIYALLTVAANGLAARQWRDMGARTQEEARSFIVSSLRRRLGLVICREFARHRIRRVPYIGVPRAVVERRMQRGQLIGGPQARVPLYVPLRTPTRFQYQAGAGRLAGRA
jgi:hypothetical protein